MKMEQMILKAYKNAPEHQTNEKTAKILRKDFKRIFSDSAVSKLTASGISQKYYTMRAQNKEIVTDKVASYDWPPESEKTTFKDAMFNVMKKSDNMTITVKGTEITVVFK